MDLDKMFEAMATSSVTSRGEFFEDGLYLVETKEFEFRDGHKGLSFIAKFTVLESNNENVKPGSTRSWIVKLDGTKDQRVRAMADIKGLIFALTDVSAAIAKAPEQHPKEHEMATKLFKAAIDASFAEANKMDPQALIGVPVRLEATVVKTKPTDKNPNGGEFTRHAWSAAD